MMVWDESNEVQNTVPRNHITVHKGAVVLSIVVVCTFLCAFFLAGFHFGYEFGYWDHDNKMRKVKGDAPRKVQTEHQIAGMSDEGYRRVWK